VHDRRRFRDRVAGIALSAAAGFGLGMLAGLVAAEWLGDVDADRVRRAVARIRSSAGGTAYDRGALEAAVHEALGAGARTRYLKVRVKALGDRLLELSGTVPSEEAREHAGETARAAAPDCTVINRLLVEGEDVPAGADEPGRAPTSADER
jgi:osmotically-inducible protein OsmY